MVDSRGFCVENTNQGATLKDCKTISLFAAAFTLIVVAGGPRLCAQDSPATPPAHEQEKSTTASATPAQDPSGPQTGDAPTPAPKPDTPPPKVQPADDSGQQTKRILWIIPNYRSVSVDSHLPRFSFKDKFWLATQDSFDYSAFAYAGIFAGVAMSQNSEPDFGQGASGYGIYFAHTFADDTVENYMVEALVPAVTKEDPRYYTLGRGGVFKRTGYAVSRLFVTRTDSGKRTINLSEIVGAGAAAGIGDTYYPSDQNPWVKTYQRWISQVVQDGFSNIVKEFWPDVNHALFHTKN